MVLSLALTVWMGHGSFHGEIDYVAKAKSHIERLIDLGAFGDPAWIRRWEARIAFEPEYSDAIMAWVGGNRLTTFLDPKTGDLLHFTNSPLAGGPSTQNTSLSELTRSIFRDYWPDWDLTQIVEKNNELDARPTYRGIPLIRMSRWVVSHWDSATHELTTLDLPELKPVNEPAPAYSEADCEKARHSHLLRTLEQAGTGVPVAITDSGLVLCPDPATKGETLIYVYEVSTVTYDDRGEITALAHGVYDAFTGQTLSKGGLMYLLGSGSRPNSTATAFAPTSLTLDGKTITIVTTASTDNVVGSQEATASDGKLWMKVKCDSASHTLTAGTRHWHYSERR